MNDLLESEKSKLRYKYLSLRDRIEPALRMVYSGKIFESLKKLKIYMDASTVMFYLSYGSEVITDAMINEVLSDGKDVCVPVIVNPGDSIMYASRITGLEECSEYVYGIRQPEYNEDEIVEKKDVDLIIVPGIVFDSLGYRIGYGKGYYDRWLSSTDVEKRVGLAYESQIIDKIPNGQYDLPVSMILTENRIIETVRN